MFLCEFIVVVEETFRSGNWENKPLLLFPSILVSKRCPFTQETFRGKQWRKWGNFALTDPLWAKGPLKHFTHFRIALLPHFTKKWPTILWKCTSVHINEQIYSFKKDARQILVKGWVERFAHSNIFLDFANILYFYLIVFKYCYF